MERLFLLVSVLAYFFCGVAGISAMRGDEFADKIKYCNKNYLVTLKNIDVGIIQLIKKKIGALKQAITKNSGKIGIELGVVLIIGFSFFVQAGEEQVEERVPIVEDNRAGVVFSPEIVEVSPGTREIYENLIWSPDQGFSPFLMPRGRLMAARDFSDEESPYGVAIRGVKRKGLARSGKGSKYKDFISSPNPFLPSPRMESAFFSPDIGQGLEEDEEKTLKIFMPKGGAKIAERMQRLVQESL